MDPEYGKQKLNGHTCYICFNLLDDATALKRCQHIFCWKCIYGKMLQFGWQCCPVCHTPFGQEPLVKLSSGDGQKDVKPKLEFTKEEETESEEIETETESETETEDEEMDTEDEEMETESETESETDSEDESMDFETESEEEEI